MLFSRSDTTYISIFIMFGLIFVKLFMFFVTIPTFESPFINLERNLGILINEITYCGLSKIAQQVRNYLYLNLHRD